MSDLFRLFIDFCRTNPATGFFLMCFVYFMVRAFVAHAFRTVRILARGWPTAPFMDADGDIIHPDKEPHP